MTATQPEKRNSDLPSELIRLDYRVYTALLALCLVVFNRLDFTSDNLMTFLALLCAVSGILANSYLLVLLLWCDALTEEIRRHENTDTRKIFRWWFIGAFVLAPASSIMAMAFSIAEASLLIAVVFMGVSVVMLSNIVALESKALRQRTSKLSTPECESHESPDTMDPPEQSE